MVALERKLALLALLALLGTSTIVPARPWPRRRTLPFGDAIAGGNADKACSTLRFGNKVALLFDGGGELIGGGTLTISGDDEYKADAGDV